MSFEIFLQIMNAVSGAEQIEERKNKPQENKAKTNRPGNECYGLKYGSEIGAN